MLCPASYPDGGQGPGPMCLLPGPWWQNGQCLQQYFWDASALLFSLAGGEAWEEFGVLSRPIQTLRIESLEPVCTGEPGKPLFLAESAHARLLLLLF